MKNSFIPLLVIGSLLSAGFGLVMMNHMDGQGHGQCPFEATGITDCVQVQNSIDFVTSHLNAFSKFSSAVPINSFAISLTLLLALVLAVFIIFNKEFELLKLEPLLARNHLRESFIPPNRILLTDWLSLHENSPSFIGGR